MLYACMLADSYKNKIFFSESKLHVYIIKDCIKFLWIHVKKISKDNLFRSHLHVKVKSIMRDTQNISIKSLYIFMWMFLKSLHHHFKVHSAYVCENIFIIIDWRKILDFKILMVATLMTNLSAWVNHYL